MDDYQFVMPLPIYCYDTDMGGVVYHANFLKFMDKARTEWIRSLNVNMFDWHGQILNFVVHRANLEYSRPLTAKDQVEIVSYINRMQRVSMDVVHIVRSVADPDIIYCKGELLIAAVDDAGKPCRIPKELNIGLCTGEKA